MTHQLDCLDIRWTRMTTINTGKVEWTGKSPQVLNPTQNYWQLRNAENRRNSRADFLAFFFFSIGEECKQPKYEKEEKQNQQFFLLILLKLLLHVVPHGWCENWRMSIWLRLIYVTVRILTNRMMLKYISMPRCLKYPRGHHKHEDTAGTRRARRIDGFVCQVRFTGRHSCWNQFPSYTQRLQGERK